MELLVEDSTKHQSPVHDSPPFVPSHIPSFPLVPAVTFFNGSTRDGRELSSLTFHLEPARVDLIRTVGEEGSDFAMR